MIDAPKIVRDYLLAQSDLVALTSTRIWAEKDNPPPGYQPADGGAICFNIRGGQVGYKPLLYPSWQFKCYGESEKAAFEVYRALFDALGVGPSKGNGCLLYSQAEAMGQTLRELDTGWVFNLSFFKITIIDI